MARPVGPRKIYRYTEEFKATAVRLSNMPGVAVQDVASVLNVHPFVLSRWRKDARGGQLKSKKVKLADQTTTGLRELKKLKADYAKLESENKALKKAAKATKPAKPAKAAKPAKPAKAAKAKAAKPAKRAKPAKAAKAKAAKPAKRKAKR